MLASVLRGSFSCGTTSTCISAWRSWAFLAWLISDRSAATNRKKKGSASQIASQLLKSFATKETLSFEALYFGKLYQTSCYMFFFPNEPCSLIPFMIANLQTSKATDDWCALPVTVGTGFLVLVTLRDSSISGMLVLCVCACWQSRERLTKGTSQTFPTKEIWNIPSNLLSPSTTFQP